MNKRGFSLIELIVVIGLIGILLSLVTFGFSQYSKKSKMSSQTRLLYGDLMEYRSRALYEKKNWTFNFSSTRYGIYSSVTTTVPPVATVSFTYPVVFNVTKIVFDSRGMANDSGTVCISDTNEAVVDSVVISTTRVQIGKRKEGFSCASTNIYAQ